MVFIIAVSMVVGGTLLVKWSFMKQCNYTTGVVKDLKSKYTANGMADVPVIGYRANGVDMQLRPDDDLSYYVGEVVTVMYVKGDPLRARVYSLASFWLSGWYFWVLPCVIFSALNYSILNNGDFIEINLSGLSIKKVAREDVDSEYI